jgi:chromosome segregation ATPase
MSMRNEMIRRWKERRAASGTTTLAESSATVSRPVTADDSWKEYSNHALPKIMEAAVVAAFSSDNFRDAVASMVDPAFSKQHDKLNQLKLANLNLESTLQTRLDELPSLLQPAIDHMTSIKVATHDKELEKVLAGQDGCLHLLELFGEKIGGLEEQLQGFDGRMKALEEKVVNADLRSAIRFGEISNELQDRNATLNDRLWELEREVGGKVDGQQRRIVSLGEDLGKAIRKTQEKISDLEALQSSQKEGSDLNEELLEKIEKMGKSLTKIDSLESSLRRDIHAVSTKVSSLDTSSLESYPRRLEAIERALSGLKDEIGTQGTLASLDSKLLSANNARLDTVASNVTKLGFMLESVKEDISDNEPAQVHTEKLDSFDVKMAELLSSVGDVQKHVGSLDTSALTSHSERLGDLASTMTGIESHLKHIDTTPLSSYSETLFEIKSTIAGMRDNIDGKFSSQAETFHSIEEKISSLPESAKVDSILASLETTQEATSNGFESLSNTAGKILDITGSTRDAFASQSKTLENTSQALAAFQTETSDYLKALSIKLDKLNSHMDFGTDETLSSTLANMSEVADEFMSMVSSQGSETSTALAKIMLAAETSGSIQAEAMKALGEALGGGIDEIQTNMQELHDSTMSEIRHKNASILAEVQKSNASHAEHATQFDEVKVSADAHMRALEVGLSNLGTVGKESRTHLDSISASLDAARATNEARAAALEELRNFHQKHSISFDQLHATSIQLLEGQEKSIPLAETHGSAIATLQESVSKKEDLETLQTHLGTILEMLGKHSTALASVSTSDSISSLTKQISESRDLIAFKTDTVQGEVMSVKSLLGAQDSFKNEMLIENNKVRESVAKILKEVRSNKSFMEEHLSTARTEGVAIIDGIIGLKTLAEDSKISSELAHVKGLVQNVKDNAKIADAALQPQLQAIINNSDNASKSLAKILDSFESLEDHSATKSVLETIASLRALVQDIDVNLASVTPEILIGTKAIEHALLSHSRTITEMNHHIQAVKDDPTTSLILTEIGTVKETALGNATSLLAVNDSLSAIGGKIKDSEDAISKSIQEMYTGISEDSGSQKAGSDALAADLKRLETVLGTSTKELQENVKVIDALVRANGQAIGTSHSKLSDVHTAVSRIGTDMASIQTEHLPKLSQDIRGIDLSKLNTAASSTEKALASITTTLDELSQLSKGQDVLLSSMDGKIVQANDLASTSITNLQSSLQSLDTTLTKSTLSTAKTHGLLESHTTILDTINSSLDATLIKSTQSATKTHNLLQSHTPLLESVKSSLDTSFTQSTQSATKTHALLEAHTPVLETIRSSLETGSASTTATISALSSTLDTISTELSTIAPAVRINSAAISRVDRAVLETGAQIKSVVLDGSAKTSREIDAALEQIDESLHDSNTRLMGMSDFELPRIEQGIKELENLMERELDGGLRETRRNGTRLGVIGAKVLGTKKLFDELVDAHAHREDGGGSAGRSVEGSAVLGHVGGTGSIGHGRGEFRRLGSSRFRSHSNASSGKETSGSGVKGNHT